MSKAASVVPKKSHKERMDEQAQLAFDTLAEMEWRQLILASEERNLAFCLARIRAHVGQMGVLDTPFGDWSKDQVMSLFALVLRCGNPLLLPADASAFREFSDDIPF